MLSTRVKKLQKVLRDQKISYFLVTNPVHIRYLTGFKGVSDTEREVLVLIGPKNLTFIAPQLYQAEAKKLAANSPLLRAKIIQERNFLFQEAAALLPPKGKLAIEADNLKVNELELLKKQFQGLIVSTEGIVENLRIVKDQEEIKLIKRAVALTDQTLKELIKNLRVGMTESQLAKKAEQIAESLGGTGMAFPTIVASGKNSALPHYMPTNKKIGKGILLIDLGVDYHGYKGDLTRTFYIGKPDKKFLETYNLVLRAQTKALAVSQADKTEESTWRVARDAFGAQAKYFIHGLGHGVGSEIHEPPYLRQGKKARLRVNSAVTIEPGLYYPNWGGIRIEDFAIIQKGQPQIISKFPKKLAEITLKI